MKQYLNSLIRKHRKIDKKIQSNRLNFEQIRQLKKLKLQLKDRIQHLRRGPSRVSA